MTESWVYLFSKFTPEALLFEALGIFTLIGMYAGYWIIKKRRIGAAGDEAIPAGVVKTYLNELITDAEQMRAQLFGLLRAAQARPEGARPVPGAQSLDEGSTADSALLAKIQELEKKMAQQASAMDSIAKEKERLASELAAAKAASTDAAPVAASGGTEVSELTGKIANLEAKLAEYSIIEDDLANLKRLQQENAQLRAALSGGKLPETPQPADTAAEAAPEVPAAAEPAPAEAVAAPEPAASAEPDVSEPAANEAAAEPAPAPAQAKEPEPDATAAAALEATASALMADSGEAGFEALVDQVEQSLQPEPNAGASVMLGAGSESSPSAAKPGAKASEAAAPPVSDKSDADLVEEFEKMLNG